MKYDDASWHYGGDFPSNLPNKAGATHIGLFVAWCRLNGLGSDLHNDDLSEELEKLKQRQFTPGAWFITACDEKFTDEDLTDQGNLFADFYYYDEDTSNYLNDYLDILGEDFESLYEVPDTWESYDKLASIIKNRFEEWKPTNG